MNCLDPKGKSVLVLNLRKGSLVQIGGEQLEVIVIYDSSIYIKYKDQTHRIAHKLKRIDSSLDLVFKRRDKMQARIGLSSPFIIKRM